MAASRLIYLLFAVLSVVDVGLAFGQGMRVMFIEFSDF